MKKFFRWLYIWIGILYIFIVGPTLLSAPDTGSVFLGILLSVLYGYWSWRLWVSPLIKYFKEGFDEINR